jgi:hypothetical protein
MLILLWPSSVTIRGFDNLLLQHVQLINVAVISILLILMNHL